MKGFLAASLLTAFYRLYSLTFRAVFFNEPTKEVRPVIFANWHGNELLMINVFIGKSLGTMVSRSKDGDIMCRVLSWLGFRVVRGSSSKGGVSGLKALIGLVEKERINAALSVDGPRGPIYEVKRGVLLLAQKTGRPIVALGGAASSKYLFRKSWNQCYLPLPFSKCVTVFGKPIAVPKNATKEELEELRLEVHRELIRVNDEAAREVLSEVKVNLEDCVTGA